jgi:tetratricopeptide (TPR) repeat protein
MTPKELLFKANEAMNAKDFILASQLFTKILNKFPNHVAATKGLKKLKKTANNGDQGTHNFTLEGAINELQKGNYQNAINLSLKFKLTNPNNPMVYNLIGICYVNQQNPKEAVPYFRTALRLNKQYPEAKANLGSALLMMGKIDDAILQIEESLKENPKNAMGWNSLGNALSQKTQLKQARTAFEQAINLAPKYLNAINSLGVLLNNMEEPTQAIKIFENGLEIDPNDRDILTNLGYTLADNGKITEAIKVLSKVVSLGQYNLDVKHRLGVLKSNSGQLKDAIRTLHEVIEEDPTLSEAYRSLSLIQKFKKSDPLVSKMQNRLNQPNVTTSHDKIHIGFALGKSLHDIKEYTQERFKAYKIGNDTRRRLELQLRYR